jgi:hypothetical protein
MRMPRPLLVNSIFGRALMLGAHSVEVDDVFELTLVVGGRLRQRRGCATQAWLTRKAWFLGCV